MEKYIRMLHCRTHAPGVKGQSIPTVCGGSKEIRGSSLALSKSVL